MRTTIALAGCFLISSSVFATDSQLNTASTKMTPVVVAVAGMRTHKAVVAHKATSAVAPETPMTEGSLEKFGASGFPQ